MAAKRMRTDREQISHFSAVEACLPCLAHPPLLPLICATGHSSPAAAHLRDPIKSSFVLLLF